MPATTVRNFIAGAHAPAADGRTLDLVDPCTARPSGTAALSAADDVERALHAAREAFPHWRGTTPGDRQRALLRIADVMEARADELVAAECADTGKPVRATRDEELVQSIDQLRFFAGAARSLEGRSAGSTSPGTPRCCDASRWAWWRRSRRGTTP